MSSNYLGYKVRVFLNGGSSVDGTISYVDNQILKLENVTNDTRGRGNSPELIIQSSEMQDLEVMGKGTGRDSKVQENRSYKESLQSRTVTPFTDPAIISVNTAPIKSSVAPPLPIVPDTNTTSWEQPSNLTPSHSRKDKRTTDRDRQAFQVIQKELFREDFDFEANNAKFDKHQVFTEMLTQHPHSQLPDRDDSPPPDCKFTTDDGVEVPALTQTQFTQVIDRLQDYQIATEALIENAGRSLAQIALKLLPSQPNGVDDDSTVVVLTGVGKKGAAGLCCARHLHNHGVRVTICRARAYTLHDQQTGQRHAYRQQGGKEAQVGALPVRAVALIVDCLIGGGLRGPVQQDHPVGTLIRWANNNGAPILSLDLPSGVHPTTAQTPGMFIRPHTTLALQCPRTGHANLQGSLYLADLGIPASAITPSISDTSQSYDYPFRQHFIVRLKQ